MPAPVHPALTVGPRHEAVVVVAALSLAAWCGCRPAADVRPDDIRTSTVPRNAEPVLVAAGAGEATPSAATAPLAGGVRYEVPEGWTDGGATGMRLATLLIGDPADTREVTVIPASGTLEGNVVRWLGQLDPTAEAASLEERAAAAITAAETIDVEGTPATVVLLRGGADGDQAILGAMIPREGAGALFVKFKGDASVALRERERFTRFVSSIRWKE